MTRALTPQRTTPPTQNDLRKVLATVDSLVVAFDTLREWQKTVDAKLTLSSDEIMDTYTKQFETIFSRLNKIDTKLKDIENRLAKIENRKPTASPITVNTNKSGETNV